MNVYHTIVDVYHCLDILPCHPSATIIPVAQEDNLSDGFSSVVTWEPLVD